MVRVQSQPTQRYVDLALVLSFVDRTVLRGVPTRIAITRAAKHYRLDRALVRSAYRSSADSLT